MKSKVFPVGVVQVLRPGLTGVRNPVSVLVVDVKPVQLRQLRDAYREKFAKPGNLGGARPVEFDSLDHADQRRVGQLDLVVCLLRHGACEV